jgi:hypothetical protein
MGVLQGSRAHSSTLGKGSTGDQQTFRREEWILCSPGLDGGRDTAEGTTEQRQVWRSSPVTCSSLGSDWTVQDEARCWSQRLKSSKLAGGLDLYCYYIIESHGR